MDRAIIFLNGDRPTENDLKNASELSKDATIICADGAYDYLVGKVEPNILLGDFDSIKTNPELAGAKVVRYPSEKDYSDGYIAMQAAIDAGAKRVTVYGAFGGRADYAYVNLSLLYQAKKAGVKAALVGSGNTVTLESGIIEKQVAVGSTVSFAPFFESAHILSSEGLKYPIRDITFSREHADYGVSNVATSERIAIVAEGEVLVFIRENTYGSGSDENNLR